MANRLFYYWRILATAFAFSAFGFGGLVLRIFVFPIFILLIKNPPTRTRLSRALVHHSFRLFIGLMKCLGILNYQIQGKELLQRKGLLVLANHPTLIDVIFLISLLPDADCVVKSSLVKNPFTKGPIQACNYICNDSGIGLIDDCIQSIQDGHNLVMFPEGTRTPLDGQISLQRGAANIAVRGNLNITPVLIDCEPRSLTKGLSWWKVPPHPMQFKITVLDDVSIGLFTDSTNSVLSARILTQFLQETFSERQTKHAAAGNGN